MEEPEKTRDKEALLHLYNKILPPLAERMHAQLSGIIPLFHDFQLERVINTWTKDPDAGRAVPISLEQGNIQQMGLRLRLEGFQHAGVPSFDLSKELVFSLYRSWYEVGPDQQTIWLEKSYLQPWTEEEGKGIADSWCAVLIDEITKQLEQRS